MKQFRTLCILATLLALAPIGALRAQSSIRLVNIVADAPALDLFIDSAATPQIAGVLNGYASALAPAASGSHRATITTSGSPVTMGVYDTLITLGADSAYTFLMYGSTELGHLLLRHSATRVVPQDSTLVRFAHLSAGAGTIDVRATPGGGASFTESGLSYLGIGGYRMVPATDLTILLGPAGGASQHKSLGYMPGGGMVTVNIAGEYDPTNFDRLKIYRLVDSDSMAQTPMLPFTPIALERGEFRVAHLATGLGQLDIFVDNMASDSTPVAFRSATAKRSDLLGQHNIKISKLGMGIASPQFNVDLAIPADTVTTLVIVGAGTGASTVIMRSSTDDAPAPGSTSIRVLNAAAELASIDVEAIFADSSRHRFDNVDFKEVTPFAEVPAGIIRMLVYRSGESTPVMAVGGSLQEGGIETVIVGGMRADTTLGVNLLPEKNAESQEPMLIFSNLTISSVGGGTLSTLGHVTIAPNPAVDRVRLGCSPGRSGSVRLALYDMLGRQSLLTDEVIGGEAIISTASLPSGPYNVVAIDEDGSVTAIGRLVIAR